jgi:hypothetical protein
MRRTIEQWRRTAVTIAANPADYSPSQRWMAWAFLYEQKTGQPLRQTNTELQSLTQSPSCQGTVHNNEEE